MRPDIILGIGTRHGAQLGTIRAAVDEGLAEAGAVASDVVAVVTIEARQHEPALGRLAELLGVPLRAYPANRLAAQPVPNPSTRTGELVGTPSVAEAAVLAAGADLLVPKRSQDGVSLAVGRLAGGAQPASMPRPQQPTKVDLGHHGDAETGPGLIDLAVNVRGPAPAWLRAELHAAVEALAAYPDPAGASAAVAARHARRPDQVLLTAGAAEAFVLIARAFSPRRALVVHPQFTEPEAALRAAGHRVERLVLRPPFQLDPAAVPDDADLVMIGNPTNPTSVLHPRQALLRLLRPGRVLVVDEAFMDAVPGEPESLAAGAATGPGTDSGGGLAAPAGLLVVRSLTKTWGLAGLRVGYLLGEPSLLRACSQAQPLWSVSSLALAAAIACSAPAALAEAGRLAEQAATEREYLLSLLALLPEVEVVAGSRAPFVLIRAFGPDPGGVHGRLRTAGWAVRRADTFPGLGPGWLRAAVRDHATSDAFVTTLAAAVRAPTSENHEEQR